ncbi:MAG: D-alanyl-D-alanine carboxypeptidase family protein [Verrucomicrobiales bacterium]|nr:D-alanyl-D-alanine carboxypeptidase family protein [Verrucomicrobiales bacterium]
MTSPETYEDRIARHLSELGIPAAYGTERGMILHREATELVSVGKDMYGREQRLTPAAAAGWEAMRSSAAGQGVDLLLVSAFRSVDYQRQIWDRKLAAGQSVAQILTVSAPPGYSEHHTGRALDLTAAGCEPLTEAFETLPAFTWLAAHAGQFGFAMSYPRNNPHGVVYEPWHWCLGEG